MSDWRNSRAEYGRACPPGQADCEAYALRAFDKALQLRADTVIDICLFWDYLHYLDIHALRAFSSALRPHLHRDSRGYAFGALHAHAALDHNDYSIHDIGHLRRAPAVSPLVEHPHTQKTLTDSFSVFDIAKGTLLREGRLELYMETP